MNRDLWFGVGLLVFALLYFWQAASIAIRPKTHPLNSPQLFPEILAGAALVVGALMIRQATRTLALRKEEGFSRAEVLRGAIYIVLTLAYILLITRVGYSVATGLYVAALILVYGEVRWYWGVAMGTAVTSIITILFTKLFLVPLP